MLPDYTITDFEGYNIELHGEEVFLVRIDPATPNVWDVSDLWDYFAAQFSFDPANSFHNSIQTAGGFRRTYGTDEDEEITKFGGAVYSEAGDDILHVTSLNGTDQIHTYAGRGEDITNVDFEAIDQFSHGHHMRGDSVYSADSKSNNFLYVDHFYFRNLDTIADLVVGRFEDFDFSRDKIYLEDTLLDLKNLPSNVSIVESNGDHLQTNTDQQQFLRIQTDAGGVVFYALQGARVNMSYTAFNGERTDEDHFLNRDNFNWTKEFVNSLEAVDYVDYLDYIPDWAVADGGRYLQDADRDSIASTLAIVSGTGEGDVIAGGLNNDTIESGSGHDLVWGGSGFDRIESSFGNDTLEGGTGNDILYGQVGNDTIFGGHHDDKLYGGSGSDILVSSFGDDTLIGNSGNDTLIVDNASLNVDLLAGDGADLIVFTTKAILGGRVLTDWSSDDVLVLDDAAGFPTVGVNGTSVTVDGMVLQNASDENLIIRTADLDTALSSLDPQAGRRFDLTFVKEITFDTANSSNWTSIEDQFNASEELFKSTKYFDDGRVTLTRFDDGANSYWDYYHQYFNSDGEYYQKTTFHDDDRKTIVKYDVGAADTWDQINQYYDVSGQFYQQNTSYDDGRKTIIKFDANAGETWETIYQYQNAMGELYQKTSLYDDGRKTIVSKDVGTADSWDAIYQYYNSNGEFSRKATYFDDGRKTIVQMDVGVEEDWDKSYRYYDAGETDYRQENRVFDDGSETRTVFDLSQTQSWDEWVREFDAQGNLVNEIFL